MFLIRFTSLEGGCVRSSPYPFCVCLSTEFFCCFWINLQLAKDPMYAVSTPEVEGLCVSLNRERKGTVGTVTTSSTSFGPDRQRPLEPDNRRTETSSDSQIYASLKGN